MNSVIGMNFDAVFRRLVQQLPARFEVADGPAAACGVSVRIDIATGRALSIERIRFEEPAADAATESA
jgi:2',3'-cyclic-nucleotide 2'-phosphodiesterase